RDMVSAFYHKEVIFDQSALNEYITPKTKEYLQRLKSRFEKLSDFNALNLESELRNLANELNIKAADLVHPCRVALTGKTVGPPLFETIELMGKETVINRLQRIISQL
ncbi:MAG: hypothetical protein N2748_05975, partial [candidate division WOR-3 bacterium]|nr:hypothetical protein [candidate division WOR-3 bacterium]